MDASPMLLRFETVAPGLDFHAALVSEYARQPRPVHTHDFAEMMWVLEGEGTHWINGGATPLRAGDLLWIAAADRHVLSAQAGGLHFINVAFRLDAWHDFRRAAALPDRALTHVHVEPERRPAVAVAFEAALREFHQAPTRLTLCRFWAATLEAFAPAPPPEEESLEGPPWLARACRRMDEPERLRAGVPALVELSGVGPAHLSRTLKAATGMTPTEWVSDRRLRRAEALLLTTARPIADIALECGFENLSHFYRRFQARTGRTPRAFRLDAHRVVSPGGRMPENLTRS